MNNSFTGLRKNVRNRACRALIRELMGIRKQIILRGELRQASGWDDPLNKDLADELGKVRVTVAVTTTATTPGTQEERNNRRDEQASDETQTLLQRYNEGNALTVDDQLMPTTSKVENELSYVFDGSNPDIPQVQDPTYGYKNDALIAFILELDETMVMISRLDCQASGRTIPPSQQSMVVSQLDSLFTILQIKGGTKNMRRIAEGTNNYDQGQSDVQGSDIIPPPGKAKA